MKHIISKKSYIAAFLMILLCFISITTPITVFAKAKQPKLNVINVTMLQEQTCTVQVYRLKKKQTASFFIQDENIAYITKSTKKSCTFKSTSVGKTKLIATIYKNNKKIKTLKCTIHVTPPAVSVQFKKKNRHLIVGESLDLRKLINLKPANTAEIPVFTVNDSSCLRVTPNGFATSISPGKAIVTATIANGKSDQIIIQIKEKDKNKNK
ncbi:MAG: hypothetical protein HFJ09_12595 [Lachnospiraceae bacterium]|nr:hypothetical protein [Lachnospiraceae bacterium]